MTRPRAATAPKVALAVDRAGPAAEAARALEARGLRVVPAVPSADALAAIAGLIAYAPSAPPTATEAAAFGDICARAATAGTPLVMLIAFAQASPKRAAQRAATLAYLRSHGAILCPDPDVWIETIALVAGYGLPAGPRVAVIAPDQTWLALSATALANEQIAMGARATEFYGQAGVVGPTDVALVERSELTATSPDRVGGALVIPVVGRAEATLDSERITLVGLREAIAAATLAGRCGERLAHPLGPAPLANASEVDEARFRRQLDQLGGRAGDHETKVLLAAYGVPITRQAVATTPSAATRLAKRAGWPVQIKPWTADAPSEPEGCPVEVDLATAPDVRRAFVAVTKAAGLPEGSPVIVRETPLMGRVLSVKFLRFGALGWTVLVDIPGYHRPLAAPAPLNSVDAGALARPIEASRSSDDEPDRAALAELLQRASHMVADNDDLFESLELPRVVVGATGEGAVVVDARATLRS